MQFLLNQTLVDEPDLPPDLTILEYLRETRRLCGTKEGCASGDCGACTVVICAVDGDKLQYQSVNSCITPVGDLHGRQLIAVEHLAEADTLHCVQQAMVDCAGSQCGFCTPGFVMSLFALTKQSAFLNENQRQRIERYLGGNLCRCTGYRPIIEAAAQALEVAQSSPDQFDRSAEDTLQRLRSLHPESVSVTASQGFHRPQTLDELFELKTRYPRAPVVSGCTDFSLEITQRLKSYPHIISTSRLAAFDYCRAEQGELRIGAACSIEDFLHRIGPMHSDVRELLLRYGSTQVRNRATVGGNLGNASPIGDLPPLLLALDTTVVLQSATAKREMALQDFFIDYKKTALAEDEIITEVRFAEERLADARRFSIYKVSKRIDDDISTVCAAFYWAPAGQVRGRLTAAFGGMAAIPKRATALEDAVSGTGPDNINAALALQALARDFSPIDDARASGEYRMTVAANLFKRFLLELNNSGRDEPIKLSDIAHD